MSGFGTWRLPRRPRPSELPKTMAGKEAREECLWLRRPFKELQPLGKGNRMKLLRVVCFSAVIVLALLVMPRALAAHQEQPRLTVTDNSESRYSTTTSVAPQDRIDGGPTGRFQSSTTTDGTVDYLKEQLEPQPFTGQTTNQCLSGWAHCIRGFRQKPCCPPLRCECIGQICTFTDQYCVPW